MKNDFTMCDDFLKILVDVFFCSSICSSSRSWFFCYRFVKYTLSVHRLDFRFNNFYVYGK
jgi:hypothetical protein